MTDYKALVEVLQGIAPVRTHEPMCLHTSFRIGGPADIYVIAESAAQLRNIVCATKEYDMPLFILGRGSNILVSDAGIRGVVVENRSGRRGYALTGANLRVGSGVSLARLAYRTATAGWEGLEWAIGIPGTVGGAVVCNAGAYGGSMAEVVQRVEVLNSSCHVHYLEASALALGYHTSIFKTEGAGQRRSIILSVDLALRRAKAEDLKGRLAEYMAQRKKSQPRKPSAGSVFKNPPGYAAAWLIEQVGLKGHRRGDAQISPLHANFIVNLGQAKAADVVSLITLAQDRVWQKFSIHLEREIEIINQEAGIPV